MHYCKDLAQKLHYRNRSKNISRWQRKCILCWSSIRSCITTPSFKILTKKRHHYIMVLWQFKLRCCMRPRYSKNVKATFTVRYVQCTLDNVYHRNDSFFIVLLVRNVVFLPCNLSEKAVIDKLTPLLISTVYALFLSLLLKIHLFLTILITIYCSSTVIMRYSSPH